MIAMAVSDPVDNHWVYQVFANQGDLEGLLSCYEEDAILVAARGHHRKGHAEIRPVLQAMVDSGVRIRLELIELVRQGELALERARCTIQGSDAEPNASTVVLRRGADGQWRILIDDPGLG
jgi:uncharacterized protein (TIGR02246 family)